MRGITAGCYTAPRAAALSGVPISTVYHWARNGVVVPSVSPVPEKLWSYADLMVLRMVSWLRHPKGDVPASPMAQVRSALDFLEDHQVDPWDSDQPGESPLLVDRSGRVFLRVADFGVLTAEGRQAALPESVLDLMAPFDYLNRYGPDLRRPREHLRIIPGRCSGEPHVAHTRIPTLSLSALRARGFSVAKIAELYELELAPVREAIDLEHDLAA